jgi:hypothetical protein
VLRIGAIIDRTVFVSEERNGLAIPTTKPSKRRNQHYLRQKQSNLNTGGTRDFFRVQEIQSIQ